MNLKKTIIAIIGGSGSGKSTLEKSLYSLNKGLYNPLISTTSRGIRLKDNEVDGLHYFFKTKEEMLEEKENYIEFNTFNDNFYGVRADQLDDSKGNILVIETKGLKQIERWCHDNQWDIITIHLDIPEEKRRCMMINRGDSISSIDKRLNTDQIDKDFKKSLSVCDLTITEYHEHPELIVQEFIDQYLKDMKKMLKIIDLRDNIDLTACTLLCGNNSSGKSLLRKQLGSRVSEIGILKSMSMEMRTSEKIKFGALSTAMMDSPDAATSYSTYNLMNRLFKSICDNTKYVIIDEPEIGLSKETTLAIAIYLKKELKILSDKGIGCMVITHSEIVMNQLDSFNFIDLSSDMSLNEYLKREIVPTDLNQLKKNTLFRFIQNRLNRKNKIKGK